MDPNEIKMDDDIEMSDKNSSNSNIQKNDVNMNGNVKKKKKKLKLRFRNYKPISKKLQKCIVEPAKAYDFKNDFKDLIEESKILDHTFEDIAPKKINWDLKRDVEPQINKLEYLTKVAIRNILKKRKEDNDDDEDDEDFEDDESEYETDDSVEITDVVTNQNSNNNDTSTTSRIKRGKQELDED